jgi:hypothetical protein
MKRRKGLKRKKKNLSVIQRQVQLHNRMVTLGSRLQIMTKYVGGDLERDRRVYIPFDHKAKSLKADFLTEIEEVEIELAKIKKEILSIYTEVIQ